MVDREASSTSTEVRRTIAAPAVESIWTTPDGAALRRIDWPGERAPGAAPRGSLLFLPGRADFYEKYLESLAAWHRAGWQVTALDWRWQAGSGRYRADPRVGDVRDFAVWVEDLEAFWRDWAAQTPGPHVLAGHSMGGHLVLRAVAERRIAPDALVLSAPMLGFITPIPAALQPWFGWLMCRIGDPARMAWDAGERPGDSAATRGAALTHDDARYADELFWRAARPALDLGPASWHWVWKASQSQAVLRRAGMLEAVKVPVLMLAAQADALVSWPAIREAAARLPDAELVSYGPEAAHEILREVDPVRNRVLAAIADFLERRAPAHA